MTPLSVWFFFYLLPVSIAAGIAKLFPTKGNKPVSREALIIHAALIISILGSQYSLYISGVMFPWHLVDFFVITYAASVLIAFLMLRTLGIWYALSAFLQQATMLSMAFVLYPAYPLWAVVLFIVPIYTLAHLLKVRYAWNRMALFFLWGTGTVLLFSILPNVWLFSAVHTIAGAFLIRRGVLYPKYAIPKGFV